MGLQGDNAVENLGTALKTDVGTAVNTALDTAEAAIPATAATNIGDEVHSLLTAAAEHAATLPSVIAAENKLAGWEQHWIDELHSIFDRIRAYFS